MGKIINTYKHGDSKTKAVLTTMLVGILLSIGIGVFSVLVQLTALTFVSVVLLILDLTYIISTDFNKAGVNSEKKSKKEKKKNTSKNKEADEAGALEWVSSNKESKDLEDKKKTPGNTREDDYLDSIEESQLTKLMHKYKVKKEHVTILVDRCKSENVFECPAFLWKDKVFAYILLLEKEPRIIKYAYADYFKLKIKASVICSPSKEYDFLKVDSFLSRIYSQHIPNYRMGEDPVTRKKNYKKTLYGIGPDIYCTSGSVANILKIFNLSLELTESKMNQGNYGDYFKEVYSSRLLYNDKVFNGQEYKFRVQEILTRMAETAEYREFSNNLNQLQEAGLIPQEYADFAISKRK